MPAFPRPAFADDYKYDLQDELRVLRAHARERGVPKKRRGTLLLGTWNLANLGVQKRRPKDYRLLAEVCSWFDLFALQEVNDDLSGLRGLQGQLPGHYEVLFSDASGNRERQAFVFDRRKASPLEKIGRLSIPPNQLKNIKLEGIKQSFPGFDRGPYLAAFQSGDFRFLLLNVHLFYGSEAKADIERRSLETFAVAWWAERRRHSKFAYTKDIIALGDFNLPQLAEDDPIYRALTSRGLAVDREHLSVVGGSSLGGHKHYDQVAFFPGETPELKRVDVFDFDNVVFRDLWESKTPKQFLAYVRYFLTDHRPLWAEFDF